MNDESPRDRILDAVLTSRDPREVERELAEHPGLKEEYHRLRTIWEELGRLPAHDPPPGSREAAQRAVMEETKATPVPRPPRRLGVPVAAAVAAVVFLLGVAVGRWTGPLAGAIPGADSPALIEGDEALRYVLLVRGGAPEDEEPSEIEAMTEWARSLWSEDRLVWAERLPPETGVRLGDEAGGEIGGLFVIRANDLQDALRLAGESPHLAWGGSVDVLPTIVAAGR